jgi:ABC-type transport system substrate-binding protein
MIVSYSPGQSIELVPNPHYGGVPEISKVNDTIVVDWVQDPEVALLMLQDGQADSVFGLPTSSFSSVQQLQSEGQVKIFSFEGFHESTYAFNANISKTLEAQQFGSGYTEPSNYFSDPATRFAFIDSFDYAGYLSNFLGNAKYNAVFGSGLTSIILPGELGYPTTAQVPDPVQNLTDAKGNFSISAWRDEKITVPIIVVAGDPIDTASAEEWASTLNQISGGNITATVVQVEASQLFGDLVPGANPMGCYFLFYEGANYPDPSDEVLGALNQGGGVPVANAWSVSDFASLPPANSTNQVDVNGTMYPQSAVFGWLNGNLTAGNNVSLPTSARLEYYLAANHLEVDLGLYLFVANIYTFLYWNSHLGGIQYEENPTTSGAPILWYFWMTKS